MARTKYRTGERRKPCLGNVRLRLIDSGSLRKRTLLPDIRVNIRFVQVIPEESGQLIPSTQIIQPLGINEVPVNAKFPARIKQSPRNFRHLNTANQRNGNSSSKSCGVEQRRQDLYLSVEKMLAEVTATNAKDPSGDNDKLPVVELRPFTTKQWRPSKSRAVGETTSRAQTSLGISSPRKSTEHPEFPKKSQATPRNETGPCPRAFSVAGERISTHPKVKESHKMEMPKGPKVAFVNKMERQRTTVGDIQSGNNVNSQYSCMKRALTDMDLIQQQNIKISGKKIEKLPPKLSKLYYEPWQMYKVPSKGTNNTPQDTVDKLFMRLESLENVYLDDTIYDTFDRSSTLPSINVKRANMKKKENIDPKRQPSAKGVNGYRLGVTNTLDIMSHYGRPLDVEQHLNNELKHTIQHMRRTRDNVNILGGNFRGLINNKYDGSNSTPGELAIKENFSRLSSTKSLKSSTKSDVIKSSIENTQGLAGSLTRRQKEVPVHPLPLKSASFLHSSSLERVINTVRDSNKSSLSKQVKSNSTIDSILSNDTNKVEEVKKPEELDENKVNDEGESAPTATDSATKLAEDDTKKIDLDENGNEGQLSKSHTILTIPTTGKESSGTTTPRDISTADSTSRPQTQEATKSKVFITDQEAAKINEEDDKPVKDVEAEKDKTNDEKTP